MNKTKKKITKSNIKKNTIPQEPKEKEYVVIYESEEHYEALGYVRAHSLKEAKEKAQKELFDEAQYYNVVEAEIDEIAKYDDINFDIEQKS